MFSDEFKRDVGDFLKTQASDMMDKQLSISRAIYNERSGRLNASLSSKQMKVEGMSVEVAFPLYIRFLDMKRAAVKSEPATKTVIRNHHKVTKKVMRGKKKAVYAPIYNKYVYGYLKSAVWKRLKKSIPVHLINEFRQSVDRNFRMV